MALRSAAIVEEVGREGDVSSPAARSAAGGSRSGGRARPPKRPTCSCPTSEVHMLITDKDASDDEIRPFLEKGIEVRRA